MSRNARELSKFRYFSTFSAWLEIRKLPAELIIPDSDGAETLVPPTTYHPVPSAALLSKTQTPLAGLASNDKSGVARHFPTICLMLFWKLGRGSTKLGPPPASCHVFSRRN